MAGNVKLNQLQTWDQAKERQICSQLCKCSAKPLHPAAAAAAVSPQSPATEKRVMGGVSCARVAEVLFHGAVSAAVGMLASLPFSPLAASRTPVRVSAAAADAVAARAGQPTEPLGSRTSRSVSVF